MAPWDKADLEANQEIQRKFEEELERTYRATCPYEVKMAFYTFNQDFRLWLKEHQIDHRIMTSNRYPGYWRVFFLNADDAVQFKLIWGGT